ncbi:MAG: Maf family protein [Pyrinomonadaceae bacterium]
MLNEASSTVKLPRLILASGSPRRAEILNSVGWEFEKLVPDVDESLVDGESPEDYVRRLAALKAAAVDAADLGECCVLAADTTVVIDEHILGKPVDLDDARRMLRMLAGRRHEVLTGVAVRFRGDLEVGLQRTGVRFAPMNEAEIEFLAREGDPLDKAGAYAVQAQAALFIEGIEGDYWNVVGLPINLVYQLVKKAEAKTASAR